MATTLTVNAGSSSLKLALLDDGSEKPLVEQELDAPAATVDPDQLREALSGQLGDADCVAHRVVHGGERFREAVIVDAQVRA
ncbi:MAG: acetate/propionate family kinase, partial [Gaiellaceae bacterium]